MLRLLSQLREELRPEGGVENAIDEEVGGRVEDEAEEGDVLEDLDPEWEVEAVGVVTAIQNEISFTFTQYVTEKSFLSSHQKKSCHRSLSALT